MPDARTAVADRLFDAIARSDIDTVAQMFSPDVLVWHSGDVRDSDHRRAVKVIAWFIGATADRRYEVVDRRFFDDGFVQQHILHATARNGESIAMRVCIVIIVDAQGLITRIDEYFDPAEMRPLLTTQPS